MSNHVSPPKRPRLSLQIKPVIGVNSRASRAFACLDPKDPTTFNTLSNAYSGAIDRSTPVLTEPITAINISSDSAQNTRLAVHNSYQSHPTSLKTPSATQPVSFSGSNPLETPLPSAMTATPPLSSGAIDNNDPKVFTFAPSDLTPRTMAMPYSPVEPRTPSSRLSNMGTAKSPPYIHPGTLHSILRNSPLPATSTRTTASPRRQSARLLEKANKRVGYNTPLTQTITTNKYIKSHIDLLIEEASPYSPDMPDEFHAEKALDLALAYTDNETRDGGMTPGPFEEMRRRMAGLGTESTPRSPSGIRKRKRKEKRRRWVWTIGQEDDEEEEGGAIAALRAASAAGTIDISTINSQVGESSVKQCLTRLRESSTDMSENESVDVEMSDSNSQASEDGNYNLGPSEEMELDMKTPTVANPFSRRTYQSRALLKVQPRNDTPIPNHLLAGH